MNISKIYTYPLKGGAAIELDTAEVTAKGLLNDRMMMVISPEEALNPFVSQRTKPALALVRAVPDTQGVHFSAPGLEDIRVSHEDLQSGPLVQTSVWRDTVAALEAPAIISEWMSEAVGQKVKLVYQSPEHKRKTDSAYAPDGEVSLADGYPVLVAFTSSLEDLNRRIAENGGEGVPMTRFRPNIVVQNEIPWQEDTIAGIRLGEMAFDFVKPCTRCKVTTIDQNTAEIMGKEPLKTLATFRFSKELKGAVFAENAVPRSTGHVHVGDAVSVLEQRPATPFVIRGPK